MAVCYIISERNMSKAILIYLYQRYTGYLIIYEEIITLFFRYDKRYNNDGGLGMTNYGDYKRSAFRKNDPRSLFRSVYGYLR